MFFTIIEDNAAVLGTYVVTLPVELCRVVAEPECLQQLVIADFGRVVGDFDDFGVAGGAGTYFFVGGVGYVAAGKAGFYFNYPIQFLELRFCTPEAAASKGSGGRFFDCCLLPCPLVLYPFCFERRQKAPVLSNK